ncbi:MAG: hypothetical protein KIT33_10305 [Candidatus Kapabacteria bacterium]|nr:hypothetical protein [Ignavibacteriota bacterium]MCW5885350.1 hypothetical protein [Candidatus Kapabacteria bacterium]
MTPEEIKSQLDQFNGSENYFKHPLIKGVVYTDGVREMAQICKSYWLIDACLSWQLDKKVSNQEFQVFKLKVHEDKSATLNIEDGNYNIIAKQEIEFTDFPLDEIELYFSNSVLYLPSEH